MYRILLFLLAVVAFPILVAGCSSGNQTPVIYESLASSSQELNVREAQNLINSYRRENGLGDLRIDSILLSEANRHAHDMATQDKVGHQVSNRGGFTSRMKQVGFENIKIGENIGAGYHTVAQAFSGWRGSEAHNKNMLMPEASRMGIAAVFSPQSKYKVFWVLIVAADKTVP